LGGEVIVTVAGQIHEYAVDVQWVGNRGDGTAGYDSYDRDHEIEVAGKGLIRASSDPVFRGDPSRFNPEELLVSAISGCHMLWYLHLCAVNGVIVTEYGDTPVGVMVETPGEGGRFLEVRLHPRVAVACGDIAERARSLHDLAHQYCFVANSVNFPVRCQPVIVSSEGVRG
jgi:organic hydroperoxide reductase OsmC/OhrA